MKKPSQPLQPSASSAPPREFTIARHHATEAMRLGSAAAQHAILCGIELIRLREAHGTTQGTRNDLRTSPKASEKLSWPERVGQEVGISDDTARLWMQAARNQLPTISGALQIEASGPEVIEVVAEVLEQPAKQKIIAEIFAGQTLEQLLLPLNDTGRLDIAKLPAQKRARYNALSEAAFAGDQKAASLCRQIEAGTLDPGRAYAGWKGDETRKAQGKTGRADTDHRANLHTALKKLATSLKKYHALDPDDQAALTKYWRSRKLGQLLPPAWTVTQ